MTNSKDNDVQAALLIQYEILQNRIGLHGIRLWQLPFTYVGFSAVATPVAFTNSATLPLPAFFTCLGVIGVLVLGCMLSAWRGYKRTGQNMNEVERQLGIEQYTKYGWWHSTPYFLLCGSVVLAVFALAIFFRV